MEPGRNATRHIDGFSHLSRRVLALPKQVVFMMDTGRRLWITLTIPQRRRVIMLSGAVIVMALLEVTNVSAIAPFLALASNPLMIEENEILAFLYEFFGFNDAHSFLVAFGLGVFLLMLVSNAWSALTTWAQLRLVWSLNHQLSLRLLERYLYRPYGYFLSRNTAELSKNLLAEVQQVTNAMIQPLILATGKMVVAVGVIAVLIGMKPLLAVVVTIAVGGSYATVYAFTRRRLNAIGRDRVKANRERFVVASEAFGGIKDVKVLRVEQRFLSRFKDPSRRLARHQATSQAIAALPRYAIEPIAFGTVVLILVYFVALERDFSRIVPMLGLYAFAGYRLMPAVQQIFRAVTAVRFHSTALENVLNDLEGTSEALERPCSGVVVPMGLSQRLELKRIRFSYPNRDTPAVDDISLVIPANSAVGFVGATGSGKTTLIDVILGLLRPQAGELVVDGTVIDDQNLSAWQRSIGYVPQHIFLTDSSVAENIAFGVPRDEIDMEAVRHAARIAQIDDFIMNELPSGYDTAVGERGIRLSGGQRQRIGIARALYRDPDVIVFDEATSALDNATERYVMQAIRNLLGKKTILMVAHRLTTLANCETIFMLKHGRVVSQGTYDELVSGHGAFVEVVSGRT